LTRLEDGERFTVTTEPAASNMVTQSNNVVIWIANSFASYAIATSWFSMTATQAHKDFTV
jgi:hypothetical protein